MAYTMTPRERASIEAQVCIKAGVELAVASGGDVGTALANAVSLAESLNDLKDVIVGEGASEPSGPRPVQMTTEADIKAAFPSAETQPASSVRTSQYIADSDYSLVHKIYMHEKASGIAYGSKDSAFMDNQAIRKLFANGARQFPPDYWAESMRGKDVPVTQKGKCALGDFKIKKGLNLDADGNPSMGTGEGNHPLANKSGYFGGLVNNTPFNWSDRPAPIDPQGWLVGVDG
tara:strand:+ start:1316 stop:2011 length:696 start_codon:yes stop_codon:yes gene_type:complete